MKLGRPVKWQEDRREHFLAATQERDQYWKVAIAVDADGKILGLRGTMLHDTGAFLPWGIIVPYIAATTFPGPYVVPAYRIEATVVLTNRVPTTVVRGAGRPQAVFAMERLMDRVARELKLDRAAVRARNMIRPEQMPYSVGLVFRDGKPLVYASGDFPKSQTRALALVRLRRLSRAPGQGARAQGRYLGIGIGNYVEGTGLGPFEGVTVRVLPNGKVAVATGATTQGQGTRTTLSQIVADNVGCRLEDIVMTAGDTGAISQGIGAFASRQAINAGSSALIAGESVRKQIVALAARVLGVPEAEIDVEDGRATARSGNKPSMSLGELARAGAGHAGLLVRARTDARARAHRLFHAAAGVLLQRHARRRGRGRSVNRRRDAPQLHGRARQRQHHQPADRRRPGAGRRRARHRQRAVRMDEVRRRRAAADHDASRIICCRRRPTCRAARSSTWRRRTRSTRSASRARAKAAPFRRRPRSSRRSRMRSRRSACASPTCR